MAAYQGARRRGFALPRPEFDFQVPPVWATSTRRSGPGLIRGSVALTDIADTRLVTTGTGWGLRHSESDGCTTYRGHTPSSSTSAMAKTFAWVATNLPNWRARSAPTSGV